MKESVRNYVWQGFLEIERGVNFYVNEWRTYDDRGKRMRELSGEWGVDRGRGEVTYLRKAGAEEGEGEGERD